MSFLVGLAPMRSDAHVPQREAEVPAVEARLEFVNSSHGFQQAIVVDLILKNNSKAPVQVTALGGDTWLITLRDAEGTLYTMKAGFVPQRADPKGLTIPAKGEYVRRCELRPRHLGCFNIGHTLFFPNGDAGQFVGAAADWVYPVNVVAKIPRLRVDAPEQARDAFASKVLRLTKAEAAPQNP